MCRKAANQSIWALAYNRRRCSIRNWNIALVINAPVKHRAYFDSSKLAVVQIDASRNSCAKIEKSIKITTNINWNMLTLIGSLYLTFNLSFKLDLRTFKFETLFKKFWFFSITKFTKHTNTNSQLRLLINKHTDNTTYKLKHIHKNKLNTNTLINKLSNIHIHTQTNTQNTNSWTRKTVYLCDLYK